MDRTRSHARTIRTPPSVIRMLSRELFRQRLGPRLPLQVTTLLPRITHILRRPATMCTAAERPAIPTRDGRNILVMVSHRKRSGISKRRGAGVEPIYFLP